MSKNYEEVEIDKKIKQVAKFKYDIKKLESEPFVHLIWIVLLFMIGLFLRENEIVFIRILGFILLYSPLFSIYFLVFRIQQCQLKIKEFKSEIDTLKSEITGLEEIELNNGSTILNNSVLGSNSKSNIMTMPTEQSQLLCNSGNIVYDDIFKVKGTSHRLDAVEKAVAFIENNSEFNKHFLGKNDQQIKAYGDRVYKYDSFQTHLFELKTEPENTYDSKAIKILVNNIHIGYVPKGLNAKFFDYVNNPNYTFFGDILIVGGPYKELLYNTNKVFYNREFKYGFRILLQIIKSNDGNSENYNTIDDHGVRHVLPL